MAHRPSQITARCIQNLPNHRLLSQPSTQCESRSQMPGYLVEWDPHWMLSLEYNYGALPSNNFTMSEFSVRTSHPTSRNSKTCFSKWDSAAVDAFSKLAVARLGLEMQESRFGNAGCESGCNLIVCLSGRVAWDEANRVKFDFTRVLIRLHNQAPGKLYFFIPGTREQYIWRPRMSLELVVRKEAFSRQGQGGASQRLIMNHFHSSTHTALSQYTRRQHLLTPHLLLHTGI